MKVRVKFKDPDRMHDGVEDAVRALQKPEGISNTEWANLKGTRMEDAAAHITDKWMEYGEYLDVEFDTDAGTATVLPAGSIK